MAKVRDTRNMLPGVSVDADTLPTVEVKVGDWVGFKSDHEQTGQITKIDGNTLHLRNPNGFGGDYLRYATETTEDARDCWI